MIPGLPGIRQGRVRLQQGGLLLLLDRPGDRGQQPFPGAEVVDEHPVAGADRRGELAQAQVGDPGVEGVTRDPAAGSPGGRLLTITVLMFSVLNMSSVADESDLTAKANIRNAALRLFADRGHDAVTVREIAAAAGVSPALVVHHFGSKEGLRAAVDNYAAQAFDSLFAMGEQDLAETLTGDNWVAVAEMFARAFPHGSPLPAYLRRLLLVNDPAGAALFGRWYALTRQLLGSMTEMGVARPGEDPAVRAAFLLVNDLAVVLLRNQIAAAIGIDPLTPEGITRWAKEVTAVYSKGAFVTAPWEEPS